MARQFYGIWLLLFMILLVLLASLCNSATVSGSNPVQQFGSSDPYSHIKVKGFFPNRSWPISTKVNKTDKQTKRQPAHMDKLVLGWHFRGHCGLVVVALRPLPPFCPPHCIGPQSPLHFRCNVSPLATNPLQFRTKRKNINSPGIDIPGRDYSKVGMQNKKVSTFNMVECSSECNIIIQINPQHAEAD